MGRGTMLTYLLGTILGTAAGGLIGGIVGLVIAWILMLAIGAFEGRQYGKKVVKVAEKTRQQMIDEGMDPVEADRTMKLVVEDHLRMTAHKTQPE